MIQLAIGYSKGIVVDCISAFEVLDLFAVWYVRDESILLLPQHVDGGKLEELQDSLLDTGAGTIV